MQLFCEVVHMQNLGPFVGVPGECPAKIAAREFRKICLAGLLCLTILTKIGDFVLYI
jgi:hypothetical protein